MTPWSNHEASEQGIWSSKKVDPTGKKIGKLGPNWEGPYRVLRHAKARAYCNELPPPYTIVRFSRPSFIDFLVGHPSQDCSMASTLNCEVLISFDAHTTIKGLVQIRT